MADLHTLKRRRGVSRASITWLTTRVGEAEARKDDPGIAALLHKLKEKLELFDSDFRNHHFMIINLLEEESNLEREQTILDKHEDEVFDLATRPDLLVIMSP